MHTKNFSQQHLVLHIPRCIKSFAVTFQKRKFLFLNMEIKFSTSGYGIKDKSMTV